MLSSVLFTDQKDSTAWHSASIMVAFFWYSGSVFSALGSSSTISGMKLSLVTLCLAPS